MPPVMGYGMLERYEGKLSRTVLRREGGSNLSFLFDPTGMVNVTRIMNYNFGEPNEQINAGDALEWNNYDDDTFTLVEMNQKMANITVRGGGRATYIFNTTGTYKFGLFYNGMRGDPKIQTIVVKVNENDQILNQQIFDQIRKISGVDTS